MESSASEKTDDDEQNNCTNHRVQDAGHDRADDCEMDAKLWQKPACEKRADNTNHDVAEQSKAETTNDQPSQPAGHGTDKEKNK